MLAFAPGLVLAVPAVIMACNLHWFFVRKPAAIGFDDGYTVALGERLIDGSWLPYVDGCSHRGPFLYWLVAIAQKLSGRFDWAGPRWLMLLVSLTTIAGLVGTGYAARLPLAGGIAAILFVFLALAVHHWESAFSVIGEPIASSLGVLSLCFCTWALVSAATHKRRVWLLAVSGGLAALAGLTKQTALFLVLPIGIWVLTFAISHESTRRERLTLVLSFSAGFVGVIALTLMRYVIAGELGTFWYWFYTYNRSVYMTPYDTDSFRDAFDSFLRDQEWRYPLFFITAVLGLARPIAELRSFPRGFARAHSTAGLEVTASLLVLFAVVGLSMPMRYWAPYFQLAYPFVALVLGVAAAKLADQARGHFVARFASGILLGALLTAGVGYSANLRLRDLIKARRAGQHEPALPESMCDFLDRFSGRDESLFIWGFDADLYVTCHRHPASRFVYLTLVAGIVPPAWSKPESSRVARGSREHLLQDLERNRPPVVLEFLASMHGTSVSVVPELAAFLERNYRKLPDTETSNGRKAHVWVRSDRAPAP